MRPTERVKLLLAVTLALLILTAWTGEGKASEGDADYRTPDTWSQHFTPGGFSDMVNGIKLTDDAVMNVGLTSRYVLRTNTSGSDSDFYQYLRADVEGFKLGSGKVYGTVFWRTASDLDRNSDHSSYHFYDDILDAEISHNKSASRLYQGNITFDNVIPMTKLTAGRLYSSHINTLQIDGADFSVGTDKVRAYAFGGEPVSFYYGGQGDTVYGGGVEVTPLTGTKIAAEYTALSIGGTHDDLYNVRLDKDVIRGMHLYGIYTDLNSKNALEAGLQYRIESTKTYVRLKYKGVYNEIDLNNSYPVNPLSVTLLPYGKFNDYNVEVGQGIGRNVMVSVGAEAKDAGGEIDYDNRSYTRYYGNVDLIGLPDKDTYISLTVERWVVSEDTADSVNLGPGSASTGNDGKTQISGRISQRIMKGLDLWAGTSYNKYTYDAQSNRMEENARVVYIGGLWVVSKHVSVSTDLSLENASVFAADNIKDNYKVETWLNLVY